MASDIALDVDGGARGDGESSAYERSETADGIVVGDGEGHDVGDRLWSASRGIVDCVLSACN